MGLFVGWACTAPYVKLRVFTSAICHELVFLSVWSASITFSRVTYRLSDAFLHFFTDGHFQNKRVAKLLCLQQNNSLPWTGALLWGGWEMTVSWFGLCGQRRNQTLLSFCQNSLSPENKYSCSEAFLFSGLVVQGQLEQQNFLFFFFFFVEFQ